jgi:hypothetical protein
LGKRGAWKKQGGGQDEAGTEVIPQETQAFSPPMASGQSHACCIVSRQEFPFQNFLIRSAVISHYVYTTMARVSIALFEAVAACGSIDCVAERLDLPAAWVAERVEAARLLFLLVDRYDVN